jgi:hypothetical protein
MTPPKNNGKDLHAIFNKFAGKEVPMQEEKFTIRGKTYTQVKPADDKDPVINDMNAAASANGLKLRLWWPGMAGTMDFRTDRVNAHIEKAPDGKWRVSRDFHIG